MAQFIQRNITTNLEENSIVFFGTGPVSLASLESIASKYPVEAVITKPDTTNHGKVKKSEVKSWALEHNVPIFEPRSSADISRLFLDSRFTSQLAVVIDYGHIIPSDVIDFFPHGIINSHFSLLPQWRGADPITFAVLSGQKETGVTLMSIDSGLDTGKIIAQNSIQISPHETSETLTNKLISLSNDLLTEELPNIFSGNITPYEQDEEGVSYSRKITKEDGFFSFSKSADELEHQVRAFISWPGSYTQLDDTRVVITSTAVQDMQNSMQPGTPVLLGKKRFGIVCADKILEIIELKPAGKKIMTAEAFLAGRPKFKESLQVLSS